MFDLAIGRDILLYSILHEIHTVTHTMPCIAIFVRHGHSNVLEMVAHLETIVKRMEMFVLQSEQKVTRHRTPLVFLQGSHLSTEGQVAPVGHVKHPNRIGDIVRIEFVLDGHG